MMVDFEALPRLLKFFGVSDGGVEKVTTSLWHLTRIIFYLLLTLAIYTGYMQSRMEK